ncbi:YceI family protein [Roseateles sp. YR242]|uniref:YceI family protein n=1 Tax=Roseateles sp. YR242 TaxID=1855305 RepID=UPI000B80DDDB|nr:YceI family protein [Roseateles sp. YR242]
MPGLASRCPAWLAQQHSGEGRLYGIDAAQSKLRILVFRGGRLAGLGHHHVIGAEQPLAGQVYLPKDGWAGAGAELGFRLDQLVLDTPAWRTAMGGEFAKVLSEADIAGTRANMLKALEADRFPVVQASTVAVEAAWPRPVLRLKVVLHGQERLLDLPVEALAPEGDGPLQARGRLVLRQSDFGIQPFSVLGGLLAIQDALVVELDLVARPALACQALPT